MTDPIISVDGVSKIYPTRDGEIFAVDNVSLDVPNGGFISLLGPSGCGKSTLLLMIAGLLSTSRGAITVDGTAIDRPYTDLGIVFQDANLLDWRSVLRNLLLQAEIRGISKAECETRAHQLLDMVGLQGYADRYPYELSGGMRQRVSICRALVHDPPILLMDEPFGALDALTRDQLNLDLQDIWIKSGKTVLFVTHSITEAVFLSDTVVVMTPRPGKIGKVFNIDLPRPRNYATRDSDAFSRYTKEIRGLFEEWGVLRDHVPAQPLEARP